MPRAHRRRSNINSAFRPRTPRQPSTVDPPSLLAACPDDTVRHTLKYWIGTIDVPLFVYFIQAEDGGPVKIGKAQKPVSRLGELQCGNPRRLVIRAVVLATVETEESLHFKWRESAIRGEWFGDGNEDTIIDLARKASAKQLAAHRNGSSALSVSEFVHTDIDPTETGWRAA